MVPTSPPPLKTRPSIRQPLGKAESLAMLQDPLIHTQASRTSGGAYVSLDSLTASVRLKRWRLVLLVGIVTSVVATLNLVFSHRGVVLERFEKGALTAQQQEALLEKYNSYSGTAAAAVERPLEIFVALIVHVVVLRVLTNHVLQVESPWRVQLGVLIMGGGVGYLLVNGFNAMNVQVREMPIEPVISREDLAMDVNRTGASTIDVSYSEILLKNPTVNTILRNLILPRTVAKQATCLGGGVFDKPDAVTLGIAQQPWMKHLFPEAVDSKQMRVVLVGPDVRSNDALTVDKFPMNASVAADLLVNSMFFNARYDPWTIDPLDASTVAKNLPTLPLATTTLNVSAAKAVGLLPPTLTSTEQEDRTWFLAHSARVLQNATLRSAWNASSLKNWVLDLAHTQLSDSSPDGTTRYFVFDEAQPRTASSPRHVFVPSGNETTEPKIDMYAVCASAGGSDLLQLEYDFKAGSTWARCLNKSKSAMFVVATTKTLVADAYIENATVSTSGKLVRAVSGYGGVVVNLREVISTTIARIQRRLQDLASAFGAKCASPTGCRGLAVDLGASGQQLVVGEAALPLSQVALINYEPMPTRLQSQQPLPLVSVVRPQFYWIQHSTRGTQFVDDILMPHNVANLSVSSSRHMVRESCDLAEGNRVEVVVNNHIYMDSPVQTAYTAAAFCLFQNGVARDVIALPERPATLAFAHNRQWMHVRVSIPSLNAALSIAGCVVVLLALVVVIVWSHFGFRTHDDPLQCVTQAHTIARVLVDRSMFPTSMLDCSVATTEPKGDNDDVDHFVIQALVVQRKESAQGNDTASV